MRNRLISEPALLAIGAAFLFGASTPAAKLLIGHIHPQLLAGLLYLGSGLGLLIYGLVTKAFGGSSAEGKLKGWDYAWLAGAVLFGGIAGPVLLMIGLSCTPAGSSSLLLNMESVFTALLAWFAFKENFDRRILFGMLAIIAGSILLTWQPGAVVVSMGSLGIVAACLCWALDNNLTRNISEANPVQIAALKGFVAGLVNCTIALAHGDHLPNVSVLGQSAALGFLGYGLSLVLLGSE